MTICIMSYVIWYPNVVWSRGYHGHDEESRNGREVKIDILEGSIRIPEGFQSVSGTYWSTEGVIGTPGERYGPYGP